MLCHNTLIVQIELAKLNIGIYNDLEITFLLLRHVVGMMVIFTCCYWPLKTKLINYCGKILSIFLTIDVSTTRVARLVYRCVNFDVLCVHFSAELTFCSISTRLHILFV